MTELTPLALQDAPALIEAVFPAQKVSFEAQKERKAGAGQTLTAIGSYWKGRKPLILVRSIVLGSLLPQTNNSEKDLEIFEMLMGFDIDSLAKRTLVQNIIKPSDIASSITLDNPWDYFTHSIKVDDNRFNEVDSMQFPIDANALGLKLLWRRDINRKEKIFILKLALEEKHGYEAKAKLCKRPEEVDQDWLYEHVWQYINRYYKEYGIEAFSHQELVEQFGELRFGHQPRVADTFSGGGSIPFEAARLGCEVFASDLNPIACMLTWGSSEIIGGESEFQEMVQHALTEIGASVDKEIQQLGIEFDEHGNRAKVYLQCAEVKCPQTGWLVPLCPSWVVSLQRNVICKLRPNYENKSFEIDVYSDVSNEEIKNAKKGTLQDSSLVYELDGKTYRTPVKTLRGDYKNKEGFNFNRLRKWLKTDFKPIEVDIFQERIYAIQWIQKDSLEKSRQITYFSAVTARDIANERKIEDILTENINTWQKQGLIPDMEIEPGVETTRLTRERGWSYWHHLFTPRQLLIFALFKMQISKLNDEQLRASVLTAHTKSIEWNTRLCRWATSSRHENQVNTFSNQALNTLYNFAVRALPNLENHSLIDFVGNTFPVKSAVHVKNCAASEIDYTADVFITDPPYADAVNYHEITEFFIAWLRENPPKPFNEWTWDSRRALAIKGSGDDFRKGMVNAYKAMAEHMPDNGMQCVMFTHQDTGVWSDMIGIFWATGLQVVGAWYIATETTSEQKKGSYVQGTVILMLRKRPAGENAGFKQRLLPAVRAEVKHQIETMMHLNDEVKEKMGEPVFNDSDLQMAGYAAALKVLTAYTQIGGEDVTTFALKPRVKGEITVVDEIVQQAAEAANSLLVPEGLNTDTWQKLNGIQRFYLRMMDMETTGATKLDNYQNFAKAFRVEDYARVMGSMAANKAHLKQITKFESRDLTESTELGASWLGHIIIGLQQLIAETDPQVIISQLQAELPDFMETRLLLIDMLSFIERKATDETVREVAEVLGARLRNMRALGE
jgi:putative DNA methylase